MSGGIRNACSLVGIGVVALGGLSLWGQDTASKKDDPALERTRKQVQILDDVYKTAIVLITENYVDEASDLAAGAAFQKLFQAMREKGHHDVRLLDATGEPYDSDNAPRDEFEKAAIKALKEGKGYYERITEKNGKRYLQAATPIPVVLKKCTLCHSAYEKAKAGEPIGALGYTIEID
jgi:hypothetical protein